MDVGKDNKTTMVLGIAALILVFVMLNKMFAGLAGLLGLGDDPDLEDAKARADIRELYDRYDPAYMDSVPSEYKGVNPTPAQVADITRNSGEIGLAAVQILDAPGTVNDNEEEVYGAIRSMRSRYELLWLNRTLGAIAPGGSSTNWVGPTLGARLDQILSDKEWIPIVKYIRTLPKYA